MMASSFVDGNAYNSKDKENRSCGDRLKSLYPAVNEDETPLPRSWSPKDKYTYIGLSQNNLRVHYKGIGKIPKDAASVRSTHPIPASCGIYYFEVKIISKGRDGYMGIGLSTQGVNMNRLPGWDKNSYGYHGDDGNSFCSSGTGQPYGPTFTTGDVIGCCVNLIENTCFYTKNGVNLGIAFTDLPQNLYPTVGLQTPGEVVEANFGQSPFVFDIDDYMWEWRMKTRLTIERFPVSDRKGEWQTALQRIVSTYLVHHGFCSTAEAFARSAGQSFEEEITSIKNRQRIQKLVLAGRMGEAIDTTHQLYPGLLDRRANLLFMLKCRQFIEMVNGTDSEVRGAAIRSPKSHGGSGSSRSSPSMSPSHHGSGYSYYAHRSVTQQQQGNSAGNSPNRNIITKGHSSGGSQNTDQQQTLSESDMNAANTAMNGSNNVTSRLIENEDVEMSDGLSSSGNGTMSNGTAEVTYANGNTCDDEDISEEMEVDSPSQKRQLCGGSQAAIEKMLQFGRELQGMSQQLRRQYGKNETNKRALLAFSCIKTMNQDYHPVMLKSFQPNQKDSKIVLIFGKADQAKNFSAVSLNAFSLLAYADPWNSPVGYQLNPVQREPVCAALNSAILESYGLPRQPPLEVAIAQATECMKLMSKAGIGSCAFAGVQDYLH